MNYWLRCSTWAGYGGRHHYGELQSEDYEFSQRVQHNLTKDEARLLNADDAWSFKWEEGDESERFETKEALIEAGIHLFLEVAASGDALVVGNPVIHYDRAPTLHKP